MKNLLDNITTTNSLNCEYQIPKYVFTFYSFLLGGCNSYQILQRNFRYQKAFAAFGNAGIVDKKKEFVSIRERFVCQMHVLKSLPPQTRKWY